MRDFSAFRLHERQGEVSTLLYAKRLTQQLIVDLYSVIESAQLNWVSCNQPHLHSEMYFGLQDALFAGEKDASRVGRRVILPSSFVGGARYMIQNYQDAMAICRFVGYPDLFITFTCNPNWPEISRHLATRNQKPEDHPDIVVRMFKTKLDEMIDDLRHNKQFGTVVAGFQKRGLPHAHILLFLAKENKCPTHEDIDRFISAEIPDEASDPNYYAAVRDYMVHGPCGYLNMKFPCMDGTRCKKHFPKDYVEATIVDSEGYPVYRRRDLGRVLFKNGVPLDSRWVVPHNRDLLLKYGGHINVEWCNQSRSIKYLFKYINKGHDRVTTAFYQNNFERDHDDEVKLYYDCRYLSPCEAAWRIFEFEIQYKYPPVERLPFHLPDQQVVVFKDGDLLEEVSNRPSVKESMFEGWFQANIDYEEARDLTYVEMPRSFVWKAKLRKWELRQRGTSLGRINYVPPGSGDAYYLRLLLNVQKDCRCFEDLRKVGNPKELYPTYRDACYALGLLDDDREFVDGIKEASQWRTEDSLRCLFATLLSTDCLSRPGEVWDKCWDLLSADVQHKQRMLLRKPDLILSDDDKRNLALAEIDKLLRRRGKKLKDYNGMPRLDNSRCPEYRNSHILEEMNYDRATLRIEHEQLVANLNADQRVVYQTVLDAVNGNTGGLFFVYGYGGTGKTYVWKTLSAAIRSEGGIVLNVASSDIASLLLPGGRTAHSRFNIPINLNEDSTCSIDVRSERAELIAMCKLIIWDEAPMMHKHCFEALDRNLQDIMRTNNHRNYKRPFGNKVVVLGGDFRQILPVVNKGTRQDIVRASINSSYLWNSCRVLKLTVNMRLQNCSSSVDAQKWREFSEWIASIGDGTLGPPNDGDVDIELPLDIVLHGGEDPIGTIVNATYPDFHCSSKDYSFLEGRAILAPTLDLVDEINDYMSDKNTNRGNEFLSSDSPAASDRGSNLLQHVHTPEYLNSLKASGIPNHKLVLKIGTPVMLLRNIDHSMGLCNGTRMVITELWDHVLEAQLISGTHSGSRVLLPRMNITPSDTTFPIRFRRRQFPLIVCYAMTINKSQGQSLSNVGLF